MIDASSSAFKLGEAVGIAVSIGAEAQTMMEFYRDQLPDEVFSALQRIERMSNNIRKAAL